MYVLIEKQKKTEQTRTILELSSFDAFYFDQKNGRLLLLLSMLQLFVIAYFNQKGLKFSIIST